MVLILQGKLILTMDFISHQYYPKIERGGVETSKTQGTKKRKEADEKVVFRFFSLKLTKVSFYEVVYSHASSFFLSSPKTGEPWGRKDCQTY
jgi:hypothetical protein